MSQLKVFENEKKCPPKQPQFGVDQINLSVYKHSSLRQNRLMFRHLCGRQICLFLLFYSQESKLPVVYTPKKSLSGPRGPRPPSFCPRFCFFCKRVSDIYLNIFSLTTIVNKKIYRTLSLPEGCALAAIASVRASIIKC